MSQSAIDGTLEVKTLVRAGSLMDVHRGVLTSNSGAKQEVSVKILRCVNMKVPYMQDTDQETALINKRITHDVEIWKSLNHPNILSVLGLELEDGPYVVNPLLVPAATLNHVIQTEPDTERLLNLLKQAADGLHYLHSHTPPIVHGSINPDNVCIVDDDRAVLSDFGLHPLCEYIAEGLTLTTNNSSSNYIPAPEVLAPEECSNAQERYTIASDVYDFGSMILEVLSGKRPYYDMTRYRAIMAAMKGDLPTSKQHPALHAEDTMWDLIHSCWNISPKDRPGMDIVAAKLEARRLEFVADANTRRSSCHVL
ncbi:hypothetical protein FRB94_003085 [Tulasnella sp. JGI-2019a]|nr:hypothetical protein FRB94_003085 [Tulasnella sp. JGI-2019a]